MKRSFVAIVVGVLVLAGLALWALGDSLSWNGREVVIAGLVVALIAIAVYV
jgi:hypothetical protein